MDVSLFDFDLPDERIALRPARPRDSARMLVVRPGADPELADDRVSSLPRLLRAGDVLVVNDTRVIPARLIGRRIGRGASEPRIEVTLHMRLDGSTWKAFARPARKLEVGDRLRFGEEGRLCLLGTLDAEVAARGEGGEVTLAFAFHGPTLDAAIAERGALPLPPYIAGKRATDEQDAADYQTVYADEPGAVAAPTAGLHLTDKLISEVEKTGIKLCKITLHVGAGTFLPVKVEDTDAHGMHEERGRIDAATANALNDARAAGGRIVAVGTTVARLLETAATPGGEIRAWEGATGIFITPGYRFRAVDALMTNFHLPRSTLFMLVSAYAGLSRMQAAYAHAIASGYRFYSYGDACLLFPEDGR